MFSGCGIYTPDLCFSFGCLFPLCYELTPFLGELGIPKSKLLRVDPKGQVMKSRSLWFILDCLCFFSTERYEDGIIIIGPLSGVDGLQMWSELPM